jgi:hypothetical protein
MGDSRGEPHPFVTRKQLDLNQAQKIFFTWRAPSEGGIVKAGGVSSGGGLGVRIFSVSPRRGGGIVNPVA